MDAPIPIHRVKYFPLTLYGLAKVLLFGEFPQIWMDMSIHGISSILSIKNWLPDYAATRNICRAVSISSICEFRIKPLIPTIEIVWNLGGMYKQYNHIVEQSHHDAGLGAAPWRGSLKGSLKGCSLLIKPATRRVTIVFTNFCHAMEFFIKK